jgi:hypothetical protein
MLSDFWDKGFDKGLKIAGARHDFIAFRLYDRRELELPAGNLLKVEDPETGQTMLLDLKYSGLKERYRGTVRGHFETFSDSLKRYNVDYIEVDTSGEYISTLVKFFKKRERRR